MDTLGTDLVSGQGAVSSWQLAVSGQWELEKGNFDSALELELWTPTRLRSRAAWRLACASASAAVLRQYFGLRVLTFAAISAKLHLFSVGALCP